MNAAEMPGAIDELGALGARFVTWKMTSDGRKLPICPSTGKAASSTDPTTWGELGEAQEAVVRDRLTGFGFVLDATRDGIVGIDLDGCIDPQTGVIEPWAREVIDNLRSYAEISPSQTGAKILCRADPVPVLAANKMAMGKANGHGKAPAIEVYLTGRYFALTGQILDDVPDEICDATEALIQLAHRLAKAGDKKSEASALPEAFKAVLERDAKLRAMWSSPAGSDRSALDFALARHLRPHLDDIDIAVVLRVHPWGQIGGGVLKGKAADRQIERILEKIGPRPSPPEPQPPLVTRSMADLAGLQVPLLGYLAAGWVPKSKAVLMAGMGGSGKTTLACQLGAARAAGLPFLGLDAARGVSLALLCEDDADDAHRTLVRLAEFFGHQLGDFADFHHLAGSGGDNVLVARLANGRIAPTPFYDQWQERLGDLKATLQILDNSRHVAAINENDGAEVTAAWSLLHGLGRPTGATTLLLGHTPKNGSAEFSGNAAWENVARVRLFLGPHAAEPGEAPIENDPRRIFRRGKANANGTGRLDLVWDQGAFRLEHPEFAAYGDRLAADMRKGQACQVFLDALAILTEQHRATSHGPAARNYAPKAIRTAGLADSFSVAELETAMETLFRDGRIKAGMELWRGPDRHIVVGIGRPA